MESYKRIIIDDIKQHVPSAEVSLEVPPDPKLGDLALPCFPFAPLLRKSPAAIAADLKSKIGQHDFIENVEVVGGYLNFHLNRHNVLRDKVNAVLAEGQSLDLRERPGQESSR